MCAFLDFFASLRRIGAPLLFAGACCLSACSTAGGVSPGAGGSDTSLTVTISAPPTLSTGPAIVSGSMSVSGKITVPKGITPKKVTVQVGATIVDAKINGTAFSLAQPIDTLKFKDGTATVVVTATGTSDASGSAQVNVQIDNTLPVIEILTPKDGEVTVGKVPIQIKVADKNLQSATLQWGLYGADGSAPEAFQDLLPTTGLSVTKPGTYSFMLDRSSEPTARVMLRLTAMDNGKNSAQEAALSIYGVRPPHFVGNSGDGDGFQDEIRDMQIANMNGDGVVDAVLATSTGVAMRFGIPVLGDNGEPTGKGSGHFEQLPDPPPDTIVITGKKIPGGSMTHVLLTDLDGDEDLDVIAVGQAKVEGLGDAPVAWALLNVQYDKVDKVTKIVTPGRALKLLDTMVLPDDALSAALGDFNRDGLQDLVLGSKNDKGLTTLLLQKDPLCKTAKGSVPCLGVDKPTADDATPVTKVTSAAIFPKVSHTITQFGVTGISSIAVADFYADAEHVPDVCVGEASRALVSCYRNVKRDGIYDGKFEQAQDSYAMTDAADTRLVMAAYWTRPTPDVPPDDVPDLIVGNSKGIRWLRGNHAGTFTYDPGAEIRGPIVSDMVQADIGPDHTPYILYVEGGRAGTVVPLLPSDTSHRNMCFRTWILGGAVRKVAIADVNNDKYLDIVSLDNSPGILVPDTAPDAPPGAKRALPSALSVALGQAHEDFGAPTVHHVCALDAAGMGTHDVSAMAFADLNADQRADLMLIGKRSWSAQPGASGYCEENGNRLHKWAWAFHLYLNAGAGQEVRLNPTPRAGEFAPNAFGQSNLSGISTDCPDAPKSFGSVRDLAVADMDGDGSLDFVAARDESDYPVGGVPADAPNGCDSACEWNEANEVNNVFGTESRKDGPPTKCCKNFIAGDKDKDKNFPLHGYGGINGAPIDRASVIVFANGNKSPTPFTLGDTTDPDHPQVIQPIYAMSGGVNPVAVVAADFNGDGNRDIVTLMQENGSDQNKLKQYLEARVRVFKGVGGGKWNYVAQPAGDTWPWIDPELQYIDKYVQVSYRTVGRAPTAMAVAPLGKGKWPGIYTLGSKYGNFSFLESLGTMDFGLATHTVVGPALGSFATHDVDRSDGSTLTDVIYVLQSAIGVLIGNTAGDVPTFTPGPPLVSGATSMNFVNTVDANQDGYVDLMMIDTTSWSVVFYLGANNGSFVRYDGMLRVLPKSTRIISARLKPKVDGQPDCTDLAVQSQFGATVLRNLDCL